MAKSLRNDVLGITTGLMLGLLGAHALCLASLAAVSVAPALAAAARAMNMDVAAYIAQLCTAD